MYARGFLNQNIYEKMQEVYGVKVMITAITDKIGSIINVGVTKTLQHFLWKIMHLSKIPDKM